VKLADVAMAAGFYDQSHFSKAFKQVTGLTPTQFRANPPAC
jgi:AraC-like DNA-binding protein